MLTVLWVIPALAMLTITLTRSWAVRRPFSEAYWPSARLNPEYKSTAVVDKQLFGFQMIFFFFIAL